MNPFNLFKPRSQGSPDSHLSCICPNCHHIDRRPRNLARRVGGTVGAVAGAASGVSGILSAARIGMQVGAPAGPAGAVLSAVAAATLRGILGATIGAELGAGLGSLLDRHVLENAACRRCGYPFTMDIPGRPTPFGRGHHHHGFTPEDMDPEEELEPGLADMPGMAETIRMPGPPSPPESSGHAGSAGLPALI